MPIKHIHNMKALCFAAIERLMAQGVPLYLISTQDLQWEVMHHDRLHIQMRMAASYKSDYRRKNKLNEQGQPIK